jgi:TRAP-type C4-dicarboxylate transport system substrate-binding protein
MVVGLIIGGCATPTPTPTPIPAPTPAPTPVPTPAPAKTFELIYSGFTPQGFDTEIVPEWWSNEVEKRTDGRVKVTMYFAETLGKYMDVPEMLQGGVCDFAEFPDIRTDTLQVTNLPLLCENRAVTTDIFYNLYYRGLLPELNDYKLLWYQPVGTSNIMLRNKVTKIEDFAGVKIRTLPGIRTEFIAALGATPVALSAAEQYAALERGVVDGVTTNTDYYLLVKLNEVAKYCIWEPLYTGGPTIVMSLKTWNSLPGDIQAVMLQLSDEARYQWVQTSFKSVEEDWARMEEAGCEVYELSAAERARWQEVADYYIDKWAEELEAKGLQGKEIVKVARWIKALHED